MGVLVGPGIGVIALGMRGTQRVTLFGCGTRHKGIEHFRMRFWIGPILRDAGPLCAKALFIGISILDDESLHPLRTRQNHAEADRPPVIMKIEAAFTDL